LIESEKSMTWLGEHGPEYEVPGLIQFMVKEGILQDLSWHNDTCPSFAILDPKNEDRGVRMFVDHPVKGRREFPEWGRFIVQLGELSGKPDFELETDDLETALLALLAHAKDYIPEDRRPDFEGLVREWERTFYRKKLR
jgi:hypothetical protein